MTIKELVFLRSKLQEAAADPSTPDEVAKAAMILLNHYGSRLDEILGRS